MSKRRDFTRCCKKVVVMTKKARRCLKQMMLHAEGQNTTCLLLGNGRKDKSKLTFLFLSKCLKSLQLVVLRQFLWCCRFHCFSRHCINSLISETTISSVARRLARQDWRTAEPFKDTLHVLKHWILLTSRGHYWRKWLCNLSILQLLQMTSCLTKRYIFQQFLC